jgi:hypothetical protein
VKASNGRATLIELQGGDHNSLRESHPEIENLVIQHFRQRLVMTSGQ